MAASCETFPIMQRPARAQVDYGFDTTMSRAADDELRLGPSAADRMRRVRAPLECVSLRPEPVPCALRDPMQSVRLDRLPRLPRADALTICCPFATPDGHPFDVRTCVSTLSTADAPAAELAGSTSPSMTSAEVGRQLAAADLGVCVRRFPPQAHRLLARAVPLVWRGARTASWAQWQCGGPAALQTPRGGRAASLAVV